jgi:aminocarboxymuconate-semialdehyde decarboxylase
MTVIDTHSHWFPPEWIDLIEKEGAANGAKIGRNAKGQLTFQVPGMPYTFKNEYTDIEQRFKAMEEAGVEMHVLSLTSPTVYWAPPEFGLKLSQVWNDKCSEIVMKYPDRFIGLASVPMQAPELAVKELERAAKLPGLRGVYMATAINGVNLDDKSFFPVYAKCEEVNWPIFLHPLNTLGAERLSRYHLRNLLGNPYDTGVAAASLIFGGVMDAFPKLVVVLAHAGGAFPALVGRMDHGAAVRAEAKLPKPPSQYVRRFYYDTITHNDQILLNLIRQMGADRIMLGSDHPADMSSARPADAVERLTELSRSERDLILGGNAERLLKVNRGRQEARSAA